MAAATATDVQKAYLAYFGRPADPVGLAYWTGKDTAVMKAGFAASAEYAALYAGMNSTQMVAQVYTNLLGRTAETAGLLYWSGELAAGRQTVSSLVDAMQANALGADITTINNRVTYATAFTAALDTTAEIVGYNGTAAASAARTAVSAVVDTEASLTAATAALATSVTTVTSAGTSSSGTTYTLTAGVDNVVGSSGNDTFIADNTQTNKVASVADVLNGGAGTDTLNVYSDGAAGAMPALTSIETVNIYDQNADIDVSASSWSSVTALNLTRGDGATVTVGANVDTIGLTDLVVKGVAGTTNDTVLNFGAARTSATLNLSGITSAAAATDENIEVNGAALTSLTVNVNTASEFDNLDAAGATSIAINAAGNLTTVLATTGTATLSISGAGAVNIGALDADINTVTSTGTGALTAAIGAEVDTVVTLGSGNDVITAGTTDALVTANTLSVDAGAGTADVLVITETADVDTAADAARYKNFEIIRSGDSIDMSLFAGYTGLQVLAATNETFSKLSATQAAAVTLLGSQTANVTFDVTGATTVGNLDTLALTISDNAVATSTITAANITAAGVETVRINAVDNFTATVLTGLGAMTNMTVTGGGNVSLTTGALALNVNTVVDASALTGTFVLDATLGTTNGLSIKGSATKANTITGTDQDDVIVGGTAVDTVRNKANAATDSDTVDFVSDSAADIFEITTLVGKTTIANFDAKTKAAGSTAGTAEDLVNVSNDNVDGGEVVVTAAGAQAALTTDRTYVIEQAVGAAGSLTTGSNTTLATADFTAATLTNVAAFLSERYTGDNDAIADEFALFVLNNGTNTYIYSYADSTTANTTIDAGELALVGVVTGALLSNEDVYQTV